MDVLCGILKGLGYSLTPMLVSLSGICGLRVLWVLFIFPMEEMHTHVGLCLSYPVTWAVTGVFHLVTVVFALRKLRRMEKNSLVLET
jgi:Na+-driven multidrug efflux pump